MLKINAVPFALQLKHAFTTSHAKRTKQVILIISIHKDGLIGLGEASISSYQNKNIDELQAIFKAAIPQLEQLPFRTPEQFWQDAAPILEENPVLQTALDIAAHDWYAQKQHQPLYQLLGLSFESVPKTSYTIGIDSKEKMLEKIQEIEWPIFKIKLGMPDEVAIIKALRDVSKAIFRVDANTAWTPEQTIEMSHYLKDLGIEYIEQPLKADQWDGMKQVMEKTVLPMIADESCQVESDVERCAGHFHGINIKLMKCGGITPALRMIKKARALKLKIMIGCMLESSIGISAAASLLPLVDYADLDSPLLIVNDPADGLNFADGKITITDRLGTGARLKVSIEQ